MDTIELTIPQRVSEIELVYRSKTPPGNLIKINGSADAFNVFHNQWNQDTIQLREEFKILLLNRSNRALGIVTISQGGTTGTVIDLKMILLSAVKSNAVSIIACHNHPSGNKKPSDADCRITNKIKDAAKLLDIALLDHLILAPGSGYFSFADEGLI